MHVHILGICGTFMGGLALIARQLGHTVSGSDANVYPPMSTQLAEQGIQLMEGDSPSHLQPEPDVVIIGNAYSRGHPQVEAVLNRGLAYTSGPQWLAEQVLQDRWVLAISGTHGKTTTTSMLAWILEEAGMDPGFLIGGVAENFGISARLGESPFFVIEADEYDTAFFDKRSKFVHYHPRTLVMNNLEFDHADIFEDLRAIQKQFHHLLRTVPGNGLVLYAADTPALDEVVQQGCWSEQQTMGMTAGADWQASAIARDWHHFKLQVPDGSSVEIQWDLIGQHNAANAMAAIAAARHAGVTPAISAAALGRFKTVKRRLERLAEINGVTIYDDFAHHPTAIATTLQGLRDAVADARIIAVLEPRSNTMRMGVHQQTLAGALGLADRVRVFQPKNLQWSLQESLQELGERQQVFDSTDELISQLLSEVMPGDHIVIMSNGGFEGLHRRLISALQASSRS